MPTTQSTTREKELIRDLCALHSARSDDHQTETQTQQGGSLVRAMQEAKGASLAAGAKAETTRRDTSAS